MATVIIEIQSEADAHKVAEVLRLIKGVKKISIQEEAPGHIPGLAYTHEERVAAIRRAEESLAAGVPGIPHTEVISRIDKKIASWK
jgi:hypothetical protein